jgi:Rieske Fe-S protein
MNRAGASLGHRILLRTYPAGWRRRYGDEFLEVLAVRGTGLGDVLDILSGALDARLHPGRTPLSVTEMLPHRVQLPRLTPAATTYGVVTGVPPVGVLSRRTFMRRVLGVGVAILSIDFLGGTLSFLWPNIRTGLGAKFRLGTVDEIVAAQPSFASGEYFQVNAARAFLVNVPAAEALASGSPISLPNPSAEQLLALWRKCPHLGCLVPEPCGDLHRIRCRCHGSTYNVIGEKLKEGPAERGLDRFAVSIEADGTVVMDTSEVTQGAPNLGLDHLVFRDPYPFDATCDV